MFSTIADAAHVAGRFLKQKSHQPATATGGFQNRRCTRVYNCLNLTERVQFEQKATMATKGKSSAEFGGRTSHRKVRTVSTIADDADADAQGQSLRQAESSAGFHGWNHLQLPVGNSDGLRRRIIGRKPEK